jgi:RNA ligase (TIGR02306 family)
MNLLCPKIIKQMINIKEDMMSSLIVEVCKVNGVEKHPNADRLDIIQVKGWNCIVGRDQYKVNDLVVFVPPDSIIPDDLINKYQLEYLRNGGRVGTTKLRGCLSQGLILDVPEGKWKVGDDVSKVLNITKWEPPVASYQVTKTTSKKKMNPDFDKYTDIENIKNYNYIFQPEDYVVITEKIHGANGRYANLPIYIDKRCSLFTKLKLLFKKQCGETHEFIYGSHNVQITNNSNRKSFYGTDIWGKVAEKYDLANIIPKDYIVYGEVYGKGIQDLTYGLNSIDFVVFDIKYKDKYLPWPEVVSFCYDNNLPTVPHLYVGLWKDVNLDEFTNGKSKLDPSQIREGCVVKMYDESNDTRIGRKILKSVSPDYLMRKNGTEFK